MLVRGLGSGTFDNFFLITLSLVPSVKDSFRTAMSESESALADEALEISASLIIFLLFFTFLLALLKLDLPGESTNSMLF